MNLQRRGAALALSLVVTVAAVHTLAQGAPERSVVEIVSAGDGDNVISPSLRELLNRVDLSLRPADPEAAIAPAALARVTVDLRDADPTVVIADHGGSVVAKKTFHATSRKIALEELALFVRFTLDALVEQEHAPAPVVEDSGPDVVDLADAAPADGAAADAAPLVAPPPAREAPHEAITPPKPTRVGFDLGVFGAAQAFSPEVPVLGGVGAAASVELGRGRFRPAISAMGTYFARGSTQRDGIDVHAGLVSFRLVPSFALYDGSTLSIDAGLGGGMDIVTVDARSQRFGTTVQDLTAAVPVGTAAITGKLAIGARATFFFGIIGDADLSPRNYVVVVDGTPDPAIRPLAVRASAMMGLAIRLAGER